MLAKNDYTDNFNCSCCSSQGHKESDTTDRLNGRKEDYERSSANEMEEVLEWLEFLECILYSKGDKRWCLGCSIVSDSFATLWTVARQAPLSMRFPRQEYWKVKVPQSMLDSWRPHGL